MNAKRLKDIDPPAGTTRSVSGLGVVEFRTLSIGISVGLHERYFRQPTRVDYRAFVSTLIAEMVVDPQFGPDDADALSERARGGLRLGIADAAGLLSEYRRLAGTMLSTDERLFAVLFNAHLQISERVIARARAISDSVPNLANGLRPTALPRLKIPAVDPAASFRRSQASIDAVDRLVAGRTLDPTRRMADMAAQAGSARQSLQHLMRSPAMDVVKKAQDDIGIRSPVLDAVAQNQEAIAKLIATPIAEAVAQTQKAIVSVFRPFFVDVARRNEATIKRLLHSPTAKAFEQTQNRLTELVASPVVESVLGQGRKLGIQVGRGLVRGIEEAARLFDENWDSFLQDNPRHPKPVLFVIGSLPGVLGLPLYHSIKERHDERLIGLLESVLISPELVEEIQSAISNASLLHPVAKRQMFKALDSMREREYAEASPQLYTSLEAGFYAAAEVAGVIDGRSRFQPAVLTAKSKARKVDDLFEYLPLGPRYMRFLRSWVFGDEGARFRHGRVSDLEECRRQALLLTMAALGWLECFGDWERDGFRRLLRSEASNRASLAIPAAVHA